MTRDIVIAGFVVLAAAAAMVVALSRSRRAGLARLWEAIDYLMQWRTARLLAVLVWGWVGWHFLAR